MCANSDIFRTSIPSRAVGGGREHELSDFIGDLRRDLEQRLKEVERELANVDPLLRERDRLRAALATPPFATTATTAASPRVATKSVRTSKPRAPRGANREAIVRVVGERPGVSAAEIADVTKISRAVTYNTLAKLIEQGKIAKTELPGGQTGYKPSDGAASEG
jgi:cell division septum initiation protein DivIVA